MGGNTAHKASSSVMPFIAVFIGLWLLPVALAVMAWTIAERQERAAVSPPLVTYTTVGERTDADSREVIIDVRSGPAPIVSGGAGGTVTAVYAREGDSLSDGTPVASIDGRVLVVYTADLPQYRPLSEGDRGADVAALESFLSGVGLLAPDVVDDVLGTSTVEAVRSFQSNYGYEIDGVFRPEYVVYVGPTFIVAKSLLSVGMHVERGVELLEGVAPIETVSIVDPQLRPLVGLPEESLSLEVADQSLVVARPEMAGEDASGFAQALASSSASSERLEDGSLRRYANARLALAEPVRRGAVPSSAIYVSASGEACLFTTEAIAILLGDRHQSNVEIGTVLVDPALVGTRIVADASALPDETVEQCG